MRAGPDEFNSSLVPVSRCGSRSPSENVCQTVVGYRVTTVPPSFNQGRKSPRRVAPQRVSGPLNALCLETMNDTGYGLRRNASRKGDAGFQQGLRQRHAQTKSGVTALPSVGTSSERSRYLFPRSHEVSGANWQAWHAAPCSDAVPSLPG